MIYIAAGELVVVLVAIVLVAFLIIRHDAVMLDLIETQERERAELLTRIQRPELVQSRAAPVAHKQPTAEERARARALAQVGTVTAPQENER